MVITLNEPIRGAMVRADNLKTDTLQSYPSPFFRRELHRKHTAVSVVGKRKAEDDEWELVKDDILRLYDKHKLSEVIAFVSDRGFRRTKSKYERRLKNWRNSPQTDTDGMRTNITAPEWKYIIQQRQQREKEGKSSVVIVCGFHVPESRIKKQGRIHAYETALERYAQNRGHTPTDIIVSTPPARSVSPMPMQQSTDSTVLYFDRTPWRQFSVDIKRFFDHHANQRPSDSYLSGNDSLLLHIKYDAATGRDTFTESSHRALPPSVGDETDATLTTKTTQLELLKYLVGLISNNHINHKIEHTIMELAEDQRNLDFLGRLLSLEQIAIKAFSENLFIMALEYPNVALVRVLLDAGVDANLQDSWGKCLFEKSSSRLDIYNEDNECLEEIIWELITHGARWQRLKKSLHRDLSLNFSPVDSAILLGSPPFARRILEFSVSRQTHIQDVTLGTFIITAYMGYEDMFQELRQLRPTLVEDLKESPWVLFEAATFGMNSFVMIEHLREKGFDITAVDGSGKGNPITFALCSKWPSGGLVHYLLDSGISTEQYANGDMLQYVETIFEFDQLDEYMIYTNAEKTVPIHVATAVGTIADLTLLLNNGADPNQIGVALPFQIATERRRKDSIKVTKILLDAGAHVNLTIPSDLEIGDSEYGHYVELPRRTAFQSAVKVGNFKLDQLLWKASAWIPTIPNCTCEGLESIPFAEQWNIGASKNSVVNENLPRTQGTSLLIAYHEPDDDLCPYHDEDEWNLFVDVAKSGDEKTFSYLLEVAPPSVRQQWMTEACFSEVAGNFSWKFVDWQIQSGVFSREFLCQTATLLAAIRGNDERRARNLMHEESLTHEAKQNEFLIAAESS
ncbi:hypothetical protein BU23DRAFT_639062 [Bimuria novae-zelandiae CBS 107.79]|uniref:Clr5 domain-containing protein n=1 Tax=Bimuria novae-zelandiae CBS 107.79 TaxID=1447943 RepID=A0A6A5VBW3_9PLEO|nr:hypothetical protein BU23DRAFT_639062 [Bimuria novae-zelandiae CBS 107.79]